ncbi:unnamed protein product [Caenorhabditis angaria]|uniref:PAN-3 domain-containing protein n=1 Tax=Caenorhabditis angaria TaxID=860376 RepID=A0A9P1J3F4_9PELO|nr:unnamed protein product [Caenorhabditis angaria]
MFLKLCAFLFIQKILTVFVAVPGRPVDFESSIVLGTNYTDYTDCVKECLNITTCSAIYYNSSNLTCIRYDYGDLFSVLQVQDFPVIEIFSFKTNSTTCSKLPDTIYYSNHYSYINTGTYWEIEGRCPKDWKEFNRTMGHWCMKLYSNGAKNLETANDFCGTVAENATISGIGSQEELNYVYNESWETKNGKQVSIGVDGRLMDNCTESFKTRTDCGFPESYTFYDKYLTDYSYYKWGGENPDAIGGNGLYQQCIVCYSTNSEQTFNTFDDVVCSSQSTYYPCGRLARDL